jgi:hypothetical protein
VTVDLRADLCGGFSGDGRPLRQLGAVIEGERRLGNRAFGPTVKTAMIATWRVIDSGSGKTQSLA